MMRILYLTLALAFSPSSHAQDSATLFSATLSGLDDQPVALSRWKGKPLIVNFWARWCTPCRTEIPVLVKLRGQLKNQGLEVLGIGLEDKAEPIRDFAKVYEMDYPVLLAKDKGFELMKSLGNTKMGLPFTVLINPNGKLTLIKMGIIKPDELTVAAMAILP